MAGVGGAHNRGSCTRDPLQMAPGTPSAGRSSTARSTAGTGLGLPLVKLPCELRGGTFSLDSEVNVGAAASVCFPARRLAWPLAFGGKRTEFHISYEFDACGMAPGEGTSPCLAAAASCPRPGTYPGARAPGGALRLEG